MDIKKIIAKLPVGFVEEAAGLDGDALRAAIVRAEELLREVEGPAARAPSGHAGGEASALRRAVAALGVQP